MPIKRRATKKTKLAVTKKETVTHATPEVTKNLSLKKRLMQPKVFVGLIVVILVIVLFLFKGLFVAALVNGQPIFRFSIINELEKQGGNQTLSSLVNQSLIFQEAKKKNIQVSQSEINTATKQIEDSLKGQGQSLDAALAMQGMTRNDLATQLKLRISVEKLLADKIKVSDKEVADYIEKNKDTLPTDMKEDEIKKNVAEQLKQQKLASTSQSWLQELTKNAKINYFVNY